MSNSDRGPAETIRMHESSQSVSHSNRERFDYADALRQVGRSQDALRQYEMLKSAELPDSRRWLVFLYEGTTLQEIGRLSDAEQAFRSACAWDATTVPRVYLAGNFARQELFEEAIETLLDALPREGDTDEVWLNLALNQRALGSLEAAKRSLERALELTPDYVEALTVLEDIRSALTLGPPFPPPEA